MDVTRVRKPVTKRIILVSRVRRTIRVIRRMRSIRRLDKPGGASEPSRMNTISSIKWLMELKTTIVSRRFHHTWSEEKKYHLSPIILSKSSVMNMPDSTYWRYSMTAGVPTMVYWTSTPMRAAFRMVAQPKNTSKKWWRTSFWHVFVWKSVPTTVRRLMLLAAAFLSSSSHDKLLMRSASEPDFLTVGAVPSSSASKSLSLLSIVSSLAKTRGILFPSAILSSSTSSCS
mmetsp:Transcript_16747/g.37764  ORF Transcript_16747/g.37764 Transcript_16747/m.37764 type:complete len:229 (+) Transcript_16747:772-1458(+)